MILDYDNIDRLIDARIAARLAKDYKLCDQIRDFLDTHLVFIFDAPHGQEIYYLTENYFAKRPQDVTHRKFVEYRIAQDIKAEKLFLAWLETVNHSRRKNV